MTIDTFYKFASEIARRDKWFIGGFLGAVYEEWNAKHPKRKKHKKNPAKFVLKDNKHLS
jgi:hypothetical protein